jgi:hypothetical protein
LVPGLSREVTGMSCKRDSKYRAAGGGKRIFMTWHNSEYRELIINGTNIGKALHSATLRNYTLRPLSLIYALAFYAKFKIIY